MLKKIKYWIRNYFGFSKTEANGFIILLPLTFIIILASSHLKYLILTPPDTMPDTAILDSLISVLEPEEDARLQGTEKEQRLLKLHAYDPNDISGEELLDMGLPPVVVGNWIKYTEKGGIFRSAAQLKDIYGMDDELYDQISPYAEPQAVREKSRSKDQKSKTTNETKERKAAIASFDLNIADTTMLKKIRGIGPVLSARIVSFRNKLGGFHALDQLREVYGLKDSALMNLQSSVYIDKDFMPRKIMINEVSEEELRNHPYIKPKMAGAIISYRFQHGDFNTLDDLKNIKVLDTLTFKKIGPYLKF